MSRIKEVFLSQTNKKVLSFCLTEEYSMIIVLSFIFCALPLYRDKKKRPQSPFLFGSEEESVQLVWLAFSFLLQKFLSNCLWLFQTTLVVCKKHSDRLNDQKHLRKFGSNWDLSVATATSKRPMKKAVCQAKNEYPKLRKCSTLHITKMTLHRPTPTIKKCCDLPNV